SLRPDLPLTEDIAVGLAVVGSGAGTEEIRFEVAGTLGAANLSVHEHREAGLPCGKVALGYLAESVSRIRDIGERSVDVGALSMGARDRFRRDETAGCNVDALILNRCRTSLFSFLGLGLFGGHGGLESRVTGLQIAYGGIERNSSGLHFSGGVYRLGGFGARFGCARVCRCRRLTRLVNLTIALRSEEHTSELQSHLD